MKKAMFVALVVATTLTSTVLACEPVYNTTNVYNNYGGVMNVYSNNGSGYQEVNTTSTYVADTCGLCGQTWDICTCYDNQEECYGYSGYNTNCTSGCIGSGTDYNVCTSNSSCMENSEWQDLTGITYYDAYGHLCSYGGYWEGGQWITTCGYYVNGVWYPAEYDPALEVGYYDAYGNYYSYYGSSCSTQNLCYGWNRAENCVAGYNNQQVYDETTTWACDWYPEYDDCDSYDYSEDYTDCYIEVDFDADTINVINNGTIILSGTCTCAAERYRGQEFCFDDQKCSGIWYQSGDFYNQACQYMNADSIVRCF